MSAQEVRDSRVVSFNVLFDFTEFLVDIVVKLCNLTHQTIVLQSALRVLIIPSILCPNDREMMKKQRFEC